MKKVGLREKIQAMDLAFRWTYESSKKLTLVIIAVIILSGILTIVEPYAFKIIIDYLVDDSNLNLASQLGIGIIGVIANGKLVEKGSHKQLIKKKGVYSSLFKMQAEGFK